MRLHQLLETEEPILCVLEALPCLLSDGREDAISAGTRVQKMKEKDGRTHAWVLIKGRDRFNIVGSFNAETDEYNKKVGTEREYHLRFLTGLKENFDDPMELGDVCTLKTDRLLRKPIAGEVFRKAGTQFKIVEVDTNHGVYIFFTDEDGTTYVEPWRNFKEYMFKGTKREWHMQFLKGLNSED